jgi:cytochrome c peroxidase
MRILSILLCASAALSLKAGELTQLGRQLFFDKRLSADGTIHCGSCHRPDRAFTEPFAVSVGVGGVKGKFNAPSILNLRRAKRFFWDGRAQSLEQQVEGPLLNKAEMGNERAGLEARLSAIPEYRWAFRRAYGDERVTLERIAEAIAAYEKTLASEESLFDRWLKGRREGWSAEHEVGRRVFFGEGGCAKCHAGTNFTNQQLIPVEGGLRMKVPSLREVARTAPYFHDGSVATLWQVVEKHPKAGVLDEAKRKGLVRFLESLSGEYCP